MVVVWAPLWESWFRRSYSKLCWILFIRFFTIYSWLFWHIVCWALCIYIYDSLHCINLLKGPTSKFLVYVVLIQDVKDLIEQNNFIVFHTLREGNQCADFMAKQEPLQMLSCCTMPPLRMISWISLGWMLLEPSTL